MFQGQEQQQNDVGEEERSLWNGWRNEGTTIVEGEDP
jgi:hypothetical protein